MVANEAEGRAEALRRIAACRAAQAEELDLRWLQLTALDGEALTGLATLTNLDLAGNEIGPNGVHALKGLTALTKLNLTENNIGDEGAHALKGLTALTSLNLADNGIGAAGAVALKDLVNLTNLDLAGNNIGAEGVYALKDLTALTSLNLKDNRIGAEGAQTLKNFVNLTNLVLHGNGIGAEGAQALKDLVNLTNLDLYGNRIEAKGVQALRGLKKIVSLDLGTNRFQADDIVALGELVNLESLSLFNNMLESDAITHLVNLNSIKSLNLDANVIGSAGAVKLSNLSTLVRLELQANNIGDEGAAALRLLVRLEHLDLGGNGIGPDGAKAFSAMSRLQFLDLGPPLFQTSVTTANKIGTEGVKELSGLVELVTLDLGGNNITDISPLISLCNLREINLSECHLDNEVRAFWMLPSLQEAILHDASLPGVPAEILSKDNYSDNCLDRLRAHFADLSGDDVAVSDVKLMILGNGRVGKTQISRRLRGETFDEAVPSTHGIQVSSVPFAPHVFDAPVTLKIWDFGGQDIYHGTHALFLKSRAIFPLVWTPRSEAEQVHTHEGFTFRNQPLGYWLAYVRTFGGAQSPVFVIQSQCDRPEDERDPPLPPDALDGFGYKKVLHYSAKGDGVHARGHAAFEEALLDAVQWMRGSQGVAKIGPGRATVKQELEAKLEAGQRLISYQSYLGLCAEAERAGKGRVSDPALLLDYLHNTGTVFYRKGLFGDQIILDQAWALDAVYSVFDRASQSFKKIERNHGRFRRSELAEWVWQKHGVPEQELFLSFMQQCGICFAIQKEDHAKRVEAEYIAPDLLPARSDDETQKRLKLAWDEASPDAEAVLTFTLLPPGLMRALIAKIGSEAGLAAEYWRDGVCFYDEGTASRALIEQRWTEGWAGEVHIATKRGQAGVLLQRLVALVEDDRISLGARPSGKSVTGVEAKPEAREAPDAKAGETPVRPAYEPSRVLEYYVSYAWGDDTTEGKEREAVVDRLCSEAEARGKRIIRDKTEMKIGDRISTFMDRIGRVPWTAASASCCLTST
jgi:internalin A